MAAVGENETDNVKSNNEETMQYQEENEDESSESDSDESEIDEELENKLLDMQKRLEENPYLYDVHIMRILLLREHGELVRLREARDKINASFPLTEELWLEWLQDEMKISTEDNRPEILSLFERAVQDYMSVGVWLEYVQYAIGGMAEKDGIQNIRAVFERAVTAVGLHVTKGAMIWEAYREFENAIFMGLQPTPGSVPSSEQQEQIETQTKKVTTLFRRQLSVPLQDMASTYEEYKEWCTDGTDTNIDQSYSRAQFKLQRLMPYEEALLDSPPPHGGAYKSYIDYEEKQGEPARIQCIYERAIQENCLQPPMWLGYTKYLATKLRVKSITLKTYERSIRNCPWCADLWLGYTRAVERHEEQHEDIKALYERALCAGFSQPAEYLQVWTGYCDYLRRRVAWDQDHTSELKDLRQTFERAVTHLAQNYGKDGDSNCSLLQYWARIEAKFCHNQPKVRELWNDILQQGYSNQAASWLEYLNLERAFGDHKHCRKLLQKAVNSVNDFPESVCEAYINFEREEGTLEQYDQALLRCEAQMQRVEERRAKAAEKEAQLTGQRKQTDRQPFDDKKIFKRGDKKFERKQQKPHPKHDKQFNQHSDKPSKPQNVWQTSQEAVSAPLQALQELAGSTLPSSKHKRKLEDDEAPLQTDADGFKVPALPGFKSKFARTEGSSSPSAAPSGTQSRNVNTSPDTNETSKRPPPGFKPRTKAPPPGFKPKEDNVTITSTMQQMATSELSDRQQDRLHDTGEQMDTGDQEYKPNHSQDNCTVFVSNLAFDVKEDLLRTMFLKVGDIKEVRLIKNIKGHSKGFAYVQFVDEFPVEKALSMDRETLDGRPMYVSRCKQKGATTAKFKYGTGLEEGKLFIKGLPFTVTQEALDTIFSQHGKLKSVRLVTYKSGAPKGLAFVEYEDVSSVKQAILKTDGLVIGEHTISVAISNPPERKTPLSQREAFTPALGGGKRDTSERGKARTQLALLPRSLKKTSPAEAHKKQPTPETAESAPSNGDNQSQTESTGKKSNTDFRNMLLGNR